MISCFYLSDKNVTTQSINKKYITYYMKKKKSKNLSSVKHILNDIKTKGGNG